MTRSPIYSNLFSNFFLGCVFPGFYKRTYIMISVNFNVIKTSKSIVFQKSVFFILFHVFFVHLLPELIRDKSQIFSDKNLTLIKWVLFV